jgi:upstream activation factor subunit UAF30
MAKKAVKKAVKKAAPKKVAAKKAVAKKSAGKANSAFMKPLTISAELAAVVGKGPFARSEVVKKLWAYIKKNGLQDQKNKRNINADVALKAVFGGKSVVNMFEMTKLVSKHLS